MTDATIVLVLRHCYCACENMPNTRPWVGQTNCETYTCTPLQGLESTHTQCTHAPPPHWPMALRILQRAQRPHRTHAAAQRVSATQEARGDTRTHGLAPPPRRTDLTAHNAHQAQPLGRNGPLTTPTSTTGLDGANRSQRPHQAQPLWTERVASERAAPATSARITDGHDPAPAPTPSTFAHYRHAPLCIALCTA